MRETPNVKNANIEIVNGYYWFYSERSMRNSIVQFLNNAWYAISEAGPLTLEELNRRGWYLKSRVDQPDAPDSDPNLLYDVTVGDGKYRFVYRVNQPPVAYRHGEPWGAKTRDLLGSNAVMTLVAEVDELRGVIRELEEKRSCPLRGRSTETIRS